MLAETTITISNAFLMSTVCLSSGVVIGAGLWALKDDLFIPEREPKVDYDALQAEMDAEFAPISVRAGK